MNTIIVCEKDIDMKKYAGQSSPFMFDDFNLIVYPAEGGKMKFEVRSEDDGIVFRINKGLWIGYRIVEDVSEIYPTDAPGQMVVSINKQNGSIGFGEFLIPRRFMTEKDVQKSLNNLMTEEGRGAARGMIAYLSSVLCCIMLMGKEERKRRLKKSKEAIIRPSQSQTEKKDVKKQIFLLDDIVNYVADNPDRIRGKHLIRCECWEVRGHYRHYKSGRTVFISSYRKGKQKDTADPKDHVYLTEKGVV